jgi:hypothetical protein
MQIRKKAAVFVDAGAMFFALRNLHEGAHLNYPALVDRIRREVLHDVPAQDVMWVMWTTVVPQNERQVRFLQYAERDLGWTVRRFHPSEGFVVDPLATPGLTVDEHGKSRLIRFDASIAFAIGRVADERHVAVLTDSFALAEPLSKAARLASCKNAIIFFGRVLDPRWQARVKADEEYLAFHDLDLWEEEIIGERRVKDRSAWDDDFLMK